MQYLIAERQEGKTTALVEWVKRGVRTSRYPGWSRVLICANMQRADLLRGGDPSDPNHPTGLEYQQVFYLEEWRKARITDPDVEIALDDADYILEEMLRKPIALVSLTGVVVANPGQVEATAKGLYWQAGLPGAWSTLEEDGKETWRRVARAVLREGEPRGARREWMPTPTHHNERTRDTPIE